MQGGRGRGRGRGRGGGHFVQTRPLTELPVVLGTFKEDAVEFKDDEDMRALYRHGFYGKGTVSRRQPNRAMVIPPELLQSWLQASQEKTKHVFGGKRAYSSSSGDKSNRPNKLSRPADGSAVPAGSAGESTTSEGGADADEDADNDPLSTLAQEFEHYVSSAPLPDAFSAAAAAASHSHDIISFDDARMITHYVSCPPPRLRHVKPEPRRQQGQGQTGAGAGSSSGHQSAVSAAAAAGEAQGTAAPTGPVQLLTAQSSDEAAAGPAAGAGAVNDGPVIQPAAVDSDQDGAAGFAVQAEAGAGASRLAHAPAPHVRYEHMAFETSIVEPEAAVYLLDRCPPGRVVITPEVQPAAALDTGLGHGAFPTHTPQAMTALDLWRSFCSRIHNFPARYAVYASCRDAGWVVRDGHGFGCDFVLYSRGPGGGHSRTCVIVMPLRVVYSGEDEEPANGTEAMDGTSSSVPTASPLLIRLPSTPTVSGSWLTSHAHTRVIGTVRKDLVHAYATLVLPGKAPGGGQAGLACPASPDYYSPAVASYLAHPRDVVPLPVVQPQQQQDSASAGPRGAAASTPSLAPSSSRISVSFVHLSRWMLNREHVAKNDAASARLALAVAQAGIDMEEWYAEPGMGQQQEQGAGQGQEGASAAPIGAGAAAAVSSWTAGQGPTDAPRGLTKQERLVKMKQSLKQTAKAQGGQGQASGAGPGESATAAGSSSGGTPVVALDLTCLLPTPQAGCTGMDVDQAQADRDVADPRPPTPSPEASSAGGAGSSVAPSFAAHVIVVDPRSDHAQLLARAVEALAGQQHGMLHAGGASPSSAVDSNSVSIAAVGGWYQDRRTWAAGGPRGTSKATQ